MKKAIVILILTALSLSFGVALAADGVVYRDDELGFSFEMPGDFEYYGDVMQEASDLLDMDMGGIVKQPMYIGSDSNINVVYDNNKEEFDKYEKGLQNSMTRDEMDLYLFKDSVQKEYIDTVADGIVNELGNTLISSNLVDYGGKLCAVIVTKGNNPTLGFDFFQQSVNFLYKDYYMNITYTKFDVYGDLKQEDVFDQFEQCFSTLKFDTVPSNISAKLNSGITIDWNEAAGKGIIGGVSGAVIAVIVVLVGKKRAKKRRQTSDIQDKGDNDGA